MAGRNALAQAFVRIRPDDKGFRTEAQSMLKRDTADLKASAKLVMEDDKAKAAVADMRLKLADLGRQVATARATVDDKQALATLARLNVRLTALDKRIANPKIKMDGVARAEADMLAIDAGLDRINGRTATAKVKVDRKGLGGLLSNVLGSIPLTKLLGNVGALGSLGSQAASVAGEGGGALSGVGGGAGAVAPVLGYGALGAGAAALSAPAAGLAASIGGLGVVAIPTITKIGAALTQTGKQGKAAWAALDPTQRGLAKSIQGVMGAFKSVAKAAEPAVAAAGKSLAGLAKAVLPALKPLAAAGATVVKALAGPLTKFFSSPAFAKAAKSLGDIGVAAAKMIGPQLPGLLKLVLGAFKELAPAGIRLLGAIIPLAEQVLPALVPLIPPITDAMVALAPAIGQVVAAIAPVAVALAPVITFVAQLVAGLVNWLSQNHLLLPVLAAIALAIDPIPVAIGLVVAAIVHFWKTSQTFRNVVTTVFSAVGQVVLSWYEVVTNVMHGAFDAITGFFGGLIHMLAKIPGPQQAAMKSLASGFDTAKNAGDRFFNGLHGKLEGWKRDLRNMPKKVKIEGNIEDLKSKLADALTKLKDPNLTKDRKAKIKGDIADLKQKIADARAQLSAINGTTATTYIKTVGIGVYTAAGAAAAAAARSNSLLYKAAGGYVSGPGTATSDSIPARLSNGEYVVQASAVSKYGTAMLDRINAKRFASGGLAGKLTGKAGTTLVNDLAGTVDQIKSALKSLIDDLRAGYQQHRIARRAELRLWHNLDQQAGRLERLSKSEANIASRIKAAQDYATSTTGNARQYAGLGGLNLATGRDGTVTYDQVANGLSARLSVVRSFQHDLAALGKAGLSKGLLRQIVDMGPESGDAYAKAILSAGKQGVRTLNATGAGIDSATTALGRQSADMLYDAGAQAGKGFLTGLQAQEKSLKALMSRLANSMVSTLRKRLGIHSPSRVTHEIGALTGRGLALGLAGEHGSVLAASGLLAGAAVPRVPSHRLPALAGAGRGNAERPVSVVLEVHGDGTRHGEYLAHEIRQYVRIRGGNVQATLGRP